MAAMFPHAWTSGQGDSPSGTAGKTWATALSGVTPMQLAVGLQETLMLARDFPPSAGRFRALCFGIPTLSVTKVLMKRREPHQFVALLYQNLDMYVFTRLDQRSSDRMLAEAYDASVDHVMRGGEMPDVDAKRLEAPSAREHKPASEETVKANLDAIKDLLDAKEREDHRAETTDPASP